MLKPSTTYQQQVQILKDRNCIIEDDSDCAKMLERINLRCCSDLRNICAHYGRLYGWHFTSAPAGLPELSDKAKFQLYGAIMAVRSLFPDEKKWNNEYVIQIATLMQEYEDVIELNLIGFPAERGNMLEI